MKKQINFNARLVIVFLFILIVQRHVTAQSIELANITKQGFKGLRPMNKDGYYIQCIEGTKGMIKPKVQMHIYVLNNDLKTTSDFALELSATDRIEDVAFNNGNFMIIYSSAAAKTRTFKVVNQQGVEVASKKLEKVNTRLLTKPAMIAPVGNDFLVINYVKEKKVGYSVERYTAKLEEVYSQTQIPEKKKLYPVDYAISGKMLYVLEFLDADFNDTFEYTITTYDLEVGVKKQTSLLVSKDEKAYGFATFLKPLKNGGVATGGMYFNGPRVQEANSDGFFVARLAEDGQLTFSYTDWKDVAAKMKDKSTAAFWGGKTKTFVHDLWINEDGTLTLIGENYRRGDADLAGGKSKSALGIAGKFAKVTGGGDGDSDIAVTVSEFSLMDFDANVTLTSVRKIDKPNSVTIIKNTTDKDDAPFIGQKKGLNLANILNNRGYFPYRFVASGSTPYLVYWQRYDPIIKELIYFTPLNATGIDTVSMDVTGNELRLSQELQNKILGKMGALGRFAKKANDVTGSSYENTFELRGSHDPFDYRAKELSTRVIPANVPGKIVVYDFAPQLDEGEKKSFSAQMMDNAQGILKIWYIDLPK
jgi:hypothetical protein